MKKYIVNWFSKDDITLIDEWFDNKVDAINFFNKTNIGDYFTMKTISFESDELYELTNIQIDEVDNMENWWSQREIQTLFSK